MYLNHQAMLQCIHGGRVMLIPPPMRSMHVMGSPILTAEDLQKAFIVACPQIGPGIKPCTKVTSIVLGRSMKIKVDGETPLLDSLLAMTDGGPPGMVRAASDGGSNATPGMSLQLASVASAARSGAAFCAECARGAAAAITGALSPAWNAAKSKALGPSAGGGQRPLGPGPESPRLDDERREPSSSPALAGITARERELAASSQVSEAARDARQKVATAFYRQHAKPSDKWPEARVAIHVKAIDLDKPVIPRMSPPPARCVSWQVPGGEQGNYYANEGSTPTELGTEPLGRDGAKRIVFKAPLEYDVRKGTVVLESTAAPVHADWSVRPLDKQKALGKLGDLGITHRSKGGGTQYFVGDKSSAVAR